MAAGTLLQPGWRQERSSLFHGAGCPAMSARSLKIKRSSVQRVQPPPENFMASIRAEEWVGPLHNIPLGVAGIWVIPKQET